MILQKIFNFLIDLTQLFCLVLRMQFNEQNLFYIFKLIQALPWHYWILIFVIFSSNLFYWLCWVASYWGWQSMSRFYCYCWWWCCSCGSPAQQLSSSFTIIMEHKFIGWWRFVVLLRAVWWIADKNNQGPSKGAN